MDEEALAPELVIPLDPPVQVGNVQLSELRLSEPTLGQVRDAQIKLDGPIPTQGAQREYELTLIALHISKGRALIDALPISVVRVAVDYLEAFITAPLPDPESSDDDTQLTILLDKPLRASNGGEVHELKLRPPTGGQARSAEGLIDKNWSMGSVRRYQARLIELVAGLSPQVVSQIPISRSKEAIRYLESFEQSARPTSPK